MSYTYDFFLQLIFLKITTLLFPTSDYRHPVTTPALQWMANILSNSKVNSRKSLASGLFVASILAESISLSKKFSPELMNFLTGIVFMSIPKGQLISKGLFDVLNFPKQQRKNLTNFCPRI